MKILLLSKYGNLGASSRLRFYQYIPFLESKGMSVTTVPLLGDSYIENLYNNQSKNWRLILNSYFLRLKNILMSRKFDIIWLEKELFPYFPAWGESFLKIVGVPYIVDYDDAIFHNYDLSDNLLIRNLLKEKIDKVMNRASLVIAGNQYLAERACKAGAKKIEIIPTVIDLDRYKLKPPKRSEFFTIGWIGSPATVKYLNTIQPALIEICKDSKTRLVLVGSGEYNLHGVPLEIHSWNEATEVREIHEFDVGIMPLENGPWEQGKCGYKLIQYMACSKPVVATPLGINNQIVEHGKNGFLAMNNEQWIEAIKSLKNNQSMCEALGSQGRKKVEEGYCVQVTALKLISLIKKI